MVELQPHYTKRTRQLENGARWEKRQSDGYI
jgi:hypothetical protein